MKDGNELLRQLRTDKQVSKFYLQFFLRFKEYREQVNMKVWTAALARYSRYLDFDTSYELFELGPGGEENTENNEVGDGANDEDEVADRR